EEFGNNNTHRPAQASQRLRDHTVQGRKVKLWSVGSVNLEFSRLLGSLRVRKCCNGEKKRRMFRHSGMAPTGGTKARLVGARPGISRFRVRSFHSRPGTTEKTHAPASSGLTHSNSGNWWRNQVNCLFA